MVYYVLPFSKQGREQIKHGLDLLKNDLIPLKGVKNWSPIQKWYYPTFIIGSFVPLLVENKFFEGGITNNLAFDTISVAWPTTMLVYEFYKKEQIYTNPETRIEKSLSLLEKAIKKIF